VCSLFPNRYNLSCEGVPGPQSKKDVAEPGKPSLLLEADGVRPEPRAPAPSSTSSSSASAAASPSASPVAVEGPVAFDEMRVALSIAFALSAAP